MIDKDKDELFRSSGVSDSVDIKPSQSVVGSESTCSEQSITEQAISEESDGQDQAIEADGEADNDDHQADNLLRQRIDKVKRVTADISLQLDEQLNPEVPETESGTQSL